MSKKPALKVGSKVIWCDDKGTDRDAKVTAVYSPILIDLTLDEPINPRNAPLKTQQLHRDAQSAHVVYWRFPSEDPKPNQYASKP